MKKTKAVRELESRIDDVVDLVIDLESSRYCGAYHVEEVFFTASKGPLVLFATRQSEPFKRTSYYVYDSHLQTVANVSDDTYLPERIYEFFGLGNKDGESA